MTDLPSADGPARGSGVTAEAATLRTGRAVAAVVLLFAYNGLVIGVYSAAIPTLQARFGLAPWQMSLLFILVGVAAITSMQVSGRVADRAGARRISLGAIPLLAVAVVGVAWAPSMAVLCVAGVLLGLGNGGIDVSMNAIGVQVEKNRPRPIMSFFHGMWSVGNLVGASLLAILAPAFGRDAGRTVLAAATIAAVVGVAVFVLAWRIVPETAPVVHHDESGRRTPIPAAAYVLGLMAIAFGLGEGTAYDWSGLHVTEVAQVDVTTGSLAVTCVAAFMVVIRLSGDRLVTRFGRRAVTRFGGACSALGYVIVATATPLPALLAGWSLVGLGIGMIAPQVYAVAGHTAGGRGLAVVVTFGYATFLLSPAVIGFLVGQVGIRSTMYLPAVLLLGLLVVARILPSRGEPDRHG
ncbi:MFS transporter [Propionicicella superfundia]|uniref:MFS transporter n=1 Tax=Propionicicella superfundia TaxID=348582 RepID=UPI001FE06B3E|nr:MFS transporter [Propionicicella superfundia]